MSRPMSGRHRPRTLIALALLASVAAVGVATSTVTASAVTATDPLASVTYQQNPVHDGSYVDSSFVAPLRPLWSADLGGTVGYPVIANGRVFVTVAHSSRYGDDVEALSLATGEVLWGPKPIDGTYWTGMLAYDDGGVFAVNFDGRMTAFDAATGTQKWVTELPGQYAFTSPPTAAGGTVYVGGAGSGGTLYAVDEATGDVTWTASVMNGDHSSPAVGDRGVFVSYACEQAYRFALDGTLAWHHSTGCEGGGGRTAVLHDGDLYVRDDAGMSPATLDATSGDLLGSFDSDVAPAFDGTHMATESGGVLAVWDTDTDTRLWKTSTTDNVTAPLFANGYVVEGRSNGTVELRREQDGALAWSGSAGTQIVPADEHNAGKLVGPAIGDGALAVPAGSRLSVFVPGDQPSLTITSGPRNHQVVGPRVRFTFTSSDLDAAYTCTLDGTTSPCASPVTYARLHRGPHTFSVSVTGAVFSTAIREFRVDSSPPTVRLNRFHPMLTYDSTATIHWSATDTRGVRAYQLRLKQARRGTPLPDWTYRRETRATSATLHVRPRSRLCVSVRAEDGVGNWSRWSTAQCVLRGPGGI
jgi:outer membrane protein assembly factor BamB